MKKILISSVIIASLISASLATTSTSNKLKSRIMSNNYLSKTNGGSLSEKDAYSDGVGVFVVGIDNSKMNSAVFNKDADEAKESEISLKQLLAEKGKDSDIEIFANLAAADGEIGEACDDGNSETVYDAFDGNGICKGIIKRAEAVCAGDEIGSEFFVGDSEVLHLVVDNNTIRDNLDRAETLCVSNVTDMSFLFYENSSFNQDISSWDVSNVTDMSFLFLFNSSFNQDISNWDVSNVQNMAGMFYEAYAFNQDISNWDVSNVTVMGEMFFSAYSFNQDISNWDVSNVQNMSGMFFQATSFNQNISGWNVSNVLNYNGFSLSSPLDSNLSYLPNFN